jgi:hydrogenase nickel incorporation protein HypA/HybF
MHEYSIVQALIGEVESTAARHGGTVRRVHVRLGELAGVDRRLLATAYATFRERSVCAEAELRIEDVMAEWRCSKCDAVLEAGARLSCPACQVPARLAAGDEIVLQRVEMEVPHVQ